MSINMIVQNRRYLIDQYSPAGKTSLWMVYSILIIRMHIKWRIYFLTLVSYAIVHSLRTMWSAIKSNLTEPPFDYQVAFLGTIDMVILFVIAIFMNILGPRVQHFGAKRCLLYTLAALLLFNTLVGVFLNLDLTAQWLYVVFFGLGVGIASSTAWPSCLYMVSLYFDKRNGITLSAWNGTSQLGDFISLITFFAIVSSNEWQPQSCFFLGSFYLLVMLLLVYFLIPDVFPDQKQPEHQPPIELQQEVAHQELKEECLDPNDQDNKDKCSQQDEKRIESLSQGSEQENLPKETNHTEPSKQEQSSGPKQINLLTVWLIPGVILNVLAYGFIKSVNSFIVSWMVYYLISLDMGSEAVVVTLLWSVSVFFGGILCGLINPNLKKIFFVFELVAATVAFLLLEEFHRKIYEKEIITGIIVCAFFYGGPYSLMGTAIPIGLGNQPQVRQYENGRSAIISLVQGFGLFFSGVSLLLLPLWGISKINIVGACYCAAAALLILGEIYRTRGEGGREESQMVQAKSCK